MRAAAAVRPGYIMNAMQAPLNMSLTVTVTE
jgi:hypothetical protein